MRVVIVGGGVGGLACAQKLAASDSGIDIRLVARSLRHDFAPSFLWVMNGARRPDDASRSLEALERDGVRVTAAEVTAIDLDGGTLMTSGGEIPFDELVLAPGAELAPETIPGLAAGAHGFYTREDAERLRGALERFGGGRVLIVVASMPFKCPAAPYEAAFLIDDLLRRRGVDARVDIVTAEPQPMPVAGPDVGVLVRGLIERRGIGFSPGRRLRSVDPEAREARFADGGVPRPADPGESGPVDGGEPYDLLVAIPPHRAPAFVAESSLAGPAGWIPVDPSTLRAADRVHAIGDVTAIALPNGMMLPKAGVFAHAEGEVVAANLAAVAAGRPSTASFDGHGACFLETGSGRAGFADGDFYASPAPAVRLRPPARHWHWGKLLFEWRWLRRLR